jgi:hypothetical protein
MPDRMTYQRLRAKMRSYFIQEEEYVTKNFDSRFEKEINLLEQFFEKIEEFLKSSGFRNDQYPEYSIALHITHSLTALSNSLMLLSKGYMGDCEAVHKRAVEFFLRAIYFNEFPDEEQKWREGKPIANRKSMAKRLDKVQKTKLIFPTDLETFFEKFVYEAIYGSVNEWAHGNFKTMYHEVAIDDSTVFYTSKFCVGPKYDEGFAKRMMRRLINSSILHVLFLAKRLSIPPEKYHDLVIQGRTYIMNKE